MPWVLTSQYCSVIGTEKSLSRVSLLSLVPHTFVRVSVCVSVYPAKKILFVMSYSLQTFSFGTGSKLMYLDVFYSLRCSIAWCEGA